MVEDIGGHAPGDGGPEYCFYLLGLQVEGGGVVDWGCKHVSVMRCGTKKGLVPGARLWCDVAVQTRLTIDYQLGTLHRKTEIEWSLASLHRTSIG